MIQLNRYAVLGPEDDEAPYEEPGLDPLPGEPASCLAARLGELSGTWPNRFGLTTSSDILAIVSRPGVFS